MSESTGNILICNWYTCTPQTESGFLLEARSHWHPSIMNRIPGYLTFEILKKIVKKKLSTSTK